MPEGYFVGIDFGTSFTAAAVRRGADVKLVDIEGNGRHRIPSCVFFDERSGTLETGRAARNSSLKAPDAFERTPKRLIGTSEKLLGSRLISPAELVRAVFRRVFAECRGAHDPEAVRITHPAGWPQGRLDVLSGAARAGMADVGWDTPLLMLPEPVAAAVEAANYIPQGSAVAVYDLGGGTFDVAVVRRTGDGFEVVGQPGGVDRCGGEEFDDLLLQEVGRESQDEEGWSELLDPSVDSLPMQKARLELRDGVVDAKEQLSQTDRVGLDVPSADVHAELTRAELEELIQPQIARTVATLLDTIAGAARAGGLRDEHFAGVVLTGGASRIPLVERLIVEQTRLRVFTQPDRKGVVASGAARWGGSEPIPVGPIRETRVDDTTVGDNGAAVVGSGRAAVDPDPADLFRCRVGVRWSDTWKTRETKILVGGGDFEIRDFPSDAKSLQRWTEIVRASLGGNSVVTRPVTGVAIAGMSAVQLWSLTVQPDGSAVKVLHRFALTGANGHAPRGVKVTAREDAARLAGGVQLGAGVRQLDYTPLAVTVPDHLPVHERVTVVPRGRFLGRTDFTVFAESADLGSDVDHASWGETLFARYAAVGAEMAPAREDTFLGGVPALYHELTLRRPAGTNGSKWACWWTGIVDGRGVGVAVESRSPIARARADQYRDLFVLVQSNTGGA